MIIELWDRIDHCQSGGRLQGTELTFAWYCTNIHSKHYTVLYYTKAQYIELHSDLQDYPADLNLISVLQTGYCRLYHTVHA